MLDAAENAGLKFAPAYATNDVALLVTLAVEGVGIAVAAGAGADPEVRMDARVTAVPLTTRIPYEKVLVWRRVPAPPAPLRALLELSEPYLDNLGGALES